MEYMVNRGLLCHYKIKFMDKQMDTRKTDYLVAVITIIVSKEIINLMNFFYAPELRVLTMNIAYSNSYTKPSHITNYVRSV